MTDSQNIIYYDRRHGRERQECVLGDGLLKFAYRNPVGKWLCLPLFANALCSKMMGWYADSALSRRRIASTIAQLNIDMEEVVVPPEGFACFNDFFCRRLKAGARPFPQALDRIGSPADCRLTVWPAVEADTCIPVKGTPFHLSGLLGEAGVDVAPSFAGGALCVCRLCPADYHRYHFPDSGQCVRSWRIPGGYNSVNPVALHRSPSVFVSNAREVSLLELEQAGRCAFIAVGAFGVGSIRSSHDGGAFRRGDEKGYFTFGGSTVILLFQPHRIQFDEDLVRRSAAGQECLVRAGEAIATVIHPS